MARLLDVVLLFLRFGATAFGGPAAHVALFERECVERRRWISRERFLDLLGLASLVPGPTSTELAMQIGRERAGWAGFAAAGVAFILPASLLVAALAAIYVRAGSLPWIQGALAAVQPAAVVVIARAIVPLGRTAIRSVPMAMLVLAAALLASAGIPEIRIIVLAGLVHVAVGRPALAGLVIVALAAPVVVAAQAPRVVGAMDIGAYFLRVGSVLFGTGYVLFPVLEGDLVERSRWITEPQLLDAVAAGQATPGPLYATATFLGYLLGGARGAVAATVGIFLPAFVFSGLAATLLDRVRGSVHVRTFLQGVNGAAVGLIVVTVLTLGRTAFTGPVPVLVAGAAAAALFGARLNPALVLSVAALGGALAGVFG